MNAHRKPDHPARSSRPWLLLWLLPYLVFSVAGDGFHAHDWTPVSRLAVAVHGGPVHHAVTATPVATSGGECFACDWATNSASYVATATAATLTRTVLASSTPFRFSLHAAPAWSWQIRGPPVL